MKSIYAEIMDLAEGTSSGVLVTVVNKDGSGPAVTGTKMIVYCDGKISGTVGGGSIEKLAIEKAHTIFLTQKNGIEKYVMDEPGDCTTTGMICGGTATLFFEYFAPKNHIYIFGAGHIGKALVYHLSQLNYHITIIDDRQEALDQIEEADEKINLEFIKALNGKNVVKNSFFIIATYQHQYDDIVLKKIYSSDWQPKYIGIVSSRKKKEILFGEIKKYLPGVDLSRAFLPVGLDIGGTLPHEIAISIVAEMQAVANGKKGGHLRDS
ncbi:MAG: XdhC family protein [Candidatus Marinimicrobia bacterium]|nr:XdhC family protein [Candidatus Neomarinimicrobiota bacterium]